MRNVASIAIAVLSTLGAGALTVSAVAADEATAPAPPPAAAPQAGGLHAGHEPGQPFWSWEKD